jgi:GNAT superfamily N-acetyltransferase
VSENGYTVSRTEEVADRGRPTETTGARDLDINPRGVATRRRDASRDGHQVRVRAVSPEDLEPLRRMFARLSPKSIYRRFHMAYPVVPEWIVDYSVCVDHDARESLVAVAGRDIVGQAMYMREEDEAEIAVVVEDTWQRRGIGKLLLDELAAIAKLRGIEAFTGAVIHDNSQMLGLASAIGARRRYSVEDGAYLIRAPLRPRDGHGAVAEPGHRGSIGSKNGAATAAVGNVPRARKADLRSCSWRKLPGGRAPQKF